VKVKAPFKIFKTWESNRSTRERMNVLYLQALRGKHWITYGSIFRWPQERRRKS